MRGLEAGVFDGERHLGVHDLPGVASGRDDLSADEGLFAVLALPGRLEPLHG